MFSLSWCAADSAGEAAAGISDGLFLLVNRHQLILLRFWEVFLDVELGCVGFLNSGSDAVENKHQIYMVKLILKALSAFPRVFRIASKFAVSPRLRLPPYRV